MTAGSRGGAAAAGKLRPYPLAPPLPVSLALHSVSFFTYGYVTSY